MQANEASLKESQVVQGAELPCDEDTVNACPGHSTTSWDWPVVSGKVRARGAKGARAITSVTK